MIESLVLSPTFAAFLLASLILAVIPGPAVIFIVTRTLSQGRGAGIASLGGIALGNLGNAAAAAIGLAAVLSASAAAFLIVKLAGAAYLVYLGIKVFLARSTAAPRARLAVDDSPRAAAPIRWFREGFFVALLNPKTALFFAALLPQFISPDSPALGQSLALGCVFVAIALCTDTLYVLTASALAQRLRRGDVLKHYARYVSAATFIGLGIYAALAGPHDLRVRVHRG